MKAIIGFLAALVGVSAFAADIVHTPYAAFLQNLGGSFSNGPQTDENGGIWSYGYRTVIASTTLTAFDATQFTRTRNPAPNPNLTGMGKGTMPYVIINATDDPMSDAGTCPARPAQPKVELFVQPMYTTTQNNSNLGVPVIRFTAPRIGYYTFTAVCEPTAVGGDVTSFHIVRDGVVLRQVEINHSTKANIRIETLEEREVLLERGESIELVIGPGTLKTHNYSSDASSVKITVTEHEGLVYSLGEDMAANINAGNQDNPFCGGRWTAAQYTRRASQDPYPVSGKVNPLLWGFSRDANFIGYSEMGTTEKSPVYCCVNIRDTPQTTIVPLDPGEIFVLPSGDHNADFRFTTPCDGTWRVWAKVRNLQVGNGDNSQTGIGVFCLAGGHRLFYATLRNPKGGTMKSTEQTATTSFLKAGAFIDLVVDSLGSGDSDTTGLKFYVEKIDDAACTFMDGGHAFNVEMAKKEAATNPFTDANGVTWEVGQTAGAEGAYSKLSSYLERVPGLLAGWTPSAGALLPRLQANFNQRLVAGSEKGTDGSISGIDGDTDLYDDEFYLHPNTGAYGVLRFLAPSTGVYRVRSAFRDVSTGNVGHANPGVNCLIRANEHALVSGFACIVASNRWNATTGKNEAYSWNRQVAFLDKNRIYLRQGEPIDFSVGVDRTTQSDATAVSCRVEPDGGFEENYVNVDFKAAAGTAFAGRGRIGWAEPRWNEMVVGGTESTKLNLKAADGTRTTATFTITHGGEAIATGTRTSNVALLTSGVRSENTGDVYTFTIGGLTPQTPYCLCLYGRAIDQNKSRAQFTVGGTTSYADGTWFQRGIADLAIIDAKADANGEIAGTFRSSGQTTADFFGLQIGGSFTEAPASGLYILLK